MVKCVPKSMIPLLWDILGFLFLLFFSYNIPVLLNALRELGAPHKHEQRHLVYDFYPESVAQRGTQFIKRTMSTHDLTFEFDVRIFILIKSGSVYTDSPLFL